MTWVLIHTLILNDLEVLIKLMLNFSHSIKYMYKKFGLAGPDEKDVERSWKVHSLYLST